MADNEFIHQGEVVTSNWRVKGKPVHPAMVEMNAITGLGYANLAGLFEDVVEAHEEMDAFEARFTSLPRFGGSNWRRRQERLHEEMKDWSRNIKRD